MKTTRRGFLAGFTAILTASMIPGSAEALVYETKISKISEMFDNIVEFNDSVKAKLVHSEQYPLEDLKKSSFMVLRLLDYMQKHLKTPEKAIVNGDKEEYEQVARMVQKQYNNLEFCETWKDIPATMLESVIPVAIMRLLVGKHNVHFNARFEFKSGGKVTDPLGWFVDTYSRLILA